MKIHFGTDHAGYELKEKLKSYVSSLGYEIVDHGAFEYKPDDDYPDFIKPVAEAVSESEKSRDLSRANEVSRGIILGGSGEGEDMVADKFPSVRSAVYYGGNLEIPKLAREHNNANILSLGARFVTEDEAKQAVKIFLETPFSGDERHIRRINKIEN
jgi:ribose 5-phosphate isomerase B